MMKKKDLDFIEETLFWLKHDADTCREMMRKEWREIDSWWGYVDYNDGRITHDAMYHPNFERDIWGDVDV